MFDIRNITLVQVYFEKARTVKLHSDSLSNNLSGEDEVLEHGVVHGSQSAASWSLLLVLLSRLSCWLWKDSPLQKIVYTG